MTLGLILPTREWEKVKSIAMAAFMTGYYDNSKILVLIFSFSFSEFGLIGKNSQGNSQTLDLFNEFYYI